MIAERSNVFKAWQSFQAKAGNITRPKTEAEYEALLDLVDQLTSRFDVSLEPWNSLFGLLATYMHEWELENQPELKNPQGTPQETLAFLMEQQGISQYQLAKEGLASQGTLSQILSGDRSISKALAKKLAERFKVSPALFL
jgi:HTH-type transcriptional regulator/antitoxin HigA